MKFIVKRFHLNLGVAGRRLSSVSCNFVSCHVECETVIGETNPIRRTLTFVEDSMIPSLQKA